MNTKKPRNKLSEMTDLIAGSLDLSSGGNSAKYEYSASYLSVREKLIIGAWKVFEHTVDGVPYSEVFCANTFRNISAENVQYQATYEFTRNLCVKRVLVCGELALSGKKTSFDFRMNVALEWELKPGALNARPVLGYQYTSIDGQPAAVKDLPPTDSWINMPLRFEDDFMILEDGNDVKKLGRTAV